ncbi:LPD1 domain-containing protein [Sodaliphilus sp.]|uniref:MuF-C-terminal domain-containing protein n=1 Tax=Sodaliphilus sp. TaxID=2815818 RepID=UPI00388E88C3
MLTEYKSLRQSVLSALAEITNNLKLGKDYSLEQELADAIALAYNARKHGYKAGDMVSPYARQGNLFQLDDGATAGDFNNATMLMIADVLNDNRVTRLKNVIRAYNTKAADAAAGRLELWSGGVKSKKDIINEVINIINNGKEEGNTQKQKGSVQQDGAAGTSSEGKPEVKPEETKPSGETLGTEPEEAAIAAAEAVTDANPTDAQNEAAQKHADLVTGNDKAIADAQPVSLEDMRGATEVEPVAKQEQQETPKGKQNESGNKLVTDERYEQLKARMNKKLSQLNVGVDPEMLAIGTEMAVYHIEKGARKFTQFAKAMIDDLGDVIRPYLKSFYNGARDLPEVEENGWANEMTSYDEVRVIDVANFDKNVINSMDTAETVVREQQIAQQAEEAKEQIIEARNNNRKEVEQKSAEKTDEQGNPLNEDGTLKLEKLSSIDEITDEDFSAPTRSVELPALPAAVDEAIGANGKPVIIKKNIFERNAERHSDLTPDNSREILEAALYTPDLYGQNQKAKRPYNWVVINTKDKEGKNRLVLIELSPVKENAEIVHWHYIDTPALETLKRQAEREDGQLLILPSESEEAGVLSSPTNDLSSGGKVTNNSSLDQEKSEKNRRKKAKPTGEKIEDVGEKLAGARKDMRAEIAKALDDASVASLVELPFGKAYKNPNLAKAVESGALREEDARFFEAIFAAGINAKKPTLTKTEQSRKKYRVGYKTNVERWAEQTHTTLQMLKEFVEADEATRDEVMNKLLSMEYPKQEEEEQTLARLKELNPDYEGHTHEWGDKWTPNPVRVMMEVMTRLGYKPGEKLDLPFTELKPVTGFTGYRLTNPQGKTQYSTVSSVEDGIDRLVYLAKVKRGDSDVKHPMSEFSAVATKTEYAETGRYRVVYGSISSAKTKEFDSREEADRFVAELNSKGKQQSPYIAPIRDVSRRHGYVVRFCNPLTNEYSVVSEGEFDTKADAMAWLDENYESANEKANASLKTEKKKREVTADDMLTVRMATKDGKTWNYSVYINEAYANNMGMPLELRGDFESRKEAKEYADSMKDRVFKAYKEAEAQRKAFVYFSTGEDSRLGEDYRGGKDVTAEDFMNTFGFRGVQFGNWTNQKDRQMAVNQAYDSFMDLAKLLGVSPRALSLNGELGIAFGSRGSGWANAHYELAEVVINLTKTRGAGSLAHEWWHALDNYFSRSAGVPFGMVTDRESIAMREEMRTAFNDMLAKIKDSDYYKRSRERGDYWGRMHEVTARLFAEWVDQELKANGELNTFLSRGANTDSWVQMNYAIYKALLDPNKEPMSFENFADTPQALSGFPYPTAKEVEAFGDLMRNIFETVKEREEDDKVALFQVGNIDADNSTQAQQAATEAIITALGENAGLDVVMETQEAGRAAAGMSGEMMDVSEKFDNELQQQIDGTLPQGHIYEMGMPSDKLLACGIPNLPIQMNAARLKEKSSEFGHDFELSEIKGLVEAINNPVAVFDYGKNNAARNIIVNIQKDGKNFLVGLYLNPVVGGRHLEINSIRNVFPKDTHEWVNWIQQKKLIGGNTKKIQDLIDKQRINLADVEYLDLNLVAKIVQNGEYTKFSDNNFTDNTEIEFMQRPGGTVYGWAEGNRIHLTPEGINPNTPIHEYTHLWAKAVQAKNPKLWGRIKELLRDTPVWNDVVNDPAYSSIKGNEDAVASEALSRISGKDNAERMEREAQKLIDEAQGILDKADAITWYEKMKRALREFWQWVGVNLFEIEDVKSIDDVTDRVLYDLMEGTDLGLDSEYHSDAAEFSIVEDPETIKWLEDSPKIPGYRNVVLNEDGTLGSPMANGLNGKGTAKTSSFEMNKWEQSEEHPELADENGKINLVKPDGKRVGNVDYNPYIHNRPNKINKQFRQAWERPSLVYIETEIAQADLDEGYHADKAAKSVGVHNWPTANSKQQLILSRYDKPVRIVPWDEVADDWEKEFKKRGVEFDIVPPALLPILAERGVKILPPHKGMGEKKAGEMVRDAAAKAMPDTKVVDADGKPLVVYHGTPIAGFTEFYTEESLAWVSVSEDQAKITEVTMSLKKDFIQTIR